MATTIKDVSDLIKTKIQGLKDGSNNTIFQNVYDTAIGDITTYPVAVLLPKEWDGKILSTKQNDRHFKFEVSMYQENTPAGRTAQQARDVMVTAIDSFIEAFDQDKNLNFGVDYIKVTKGNFDFKAPNGPWVFAVFEVDCEVVVKNY